MCSFLRVLLYKPTSYSVWQGVSSLKSSVSLGSFSVSFQSIIRTSHLTSVSDAQRSKPKVPKMVTLSKENIGQYTSITKLLATWHKQRKSLSPDLTLTVLLKVTYLVHTSRKYDILSNTSFKRLFQSSTDNAASLEPENLVRLLWLMAKRRWIDYSSIKKLANALHDKIPELSDKSIGLVPWCLVKLKVSNQYESLIDSVVKETCHRLDKDILQFDSRALANICWSLATTNSWPEHLTRHIERFFNVRGKELSLHTLSLLLHSLSKAGVFKIDKCHLYALMTSYIPQFENTDIQSLSMLLWSIGNQKKYDKEFFSALESVVLSGRLVSKYSPRLLANLIWCCARAQYYSHDLLTHLADHVPNFIQGMTLQDLGMVSYSLGYLNYPSPKLLNMLTDCVMSSYTERSVNYQTLFNLAWTCLINEVYPTALFEMCLNGKMIERVTKDDKTRALYIHQLLQLDFASRYEHPDMGLPLLTPNDRLQFLIDATISLTCDSKFQRNVAETLIDTFGFVRTETISLSGYKLDFELLLDNNGGSISIPHSSSYESFSIETVQHMYGRMMAVDKTSNYQKLDYSNLRFENATKRNNLSCDWYTHSDHVKRRIAIEADGPNHFAANCSHPLGRTALKSRQLKAFGWNVVSIPFFEWEEFGFCQRTKMINYLKNKLANV